MRAALRRPLAAQAVQIRPLATSEDSYTTRQDKTGRPISPYAFVDNQENFGLLRALPVVAFSSLCVRFSGVAMSVGLWGIAGITLVGGDPAATMAAIGTSSLGAPAKFAVAFPFALHFIGGCRHYVSLAVSVCYDASLPHLFATYSVLGQHA